MIKFACALCLMIPLVTLAQTDTKDPVYTDSCKTAFKITERLFHDIETNKYTAPLTTEAEKQRNSRDLIDLKKALATMNSDEQTKMCDLISNKFTGDLKRLNEIKSKENAAKFLSYLYNKD